MKAIVGLVIVGLFLIVGGIGGCMYYGPEYNVYSAKMAGQATLAEANSSRFAQVAQSKAKSEAAEFEARAEVTRAYGVAKANKIIADGLGGPAGYLDYLKIQALTDSKDRIIYVPTEASLPITEAGRRP